MPLLRTSGLLEFRSRTGAELGVNWRRAPLGHDRLGSSEAGLPGGINIKRLRARWLHGAGNCKTSVSIRVN